FVGCSQLSAYNVGVKVGEGTFGEVKVADHKELNTKVALKKILMHNEKEGIPITALREIKILKALKHPNVINLIEMSYQKGKGCDPSQRERGSVYMVFPYMEHDLNGLLENPKVRFTPAHIKSFIQQLLEGTSYLHRNKVLHRDIKGANILIDAKGNLRIADFGLARSFDPTATTAQFTNVVVTRWYRPPELFLGATNYGPSVDMWGVGCVFGEMLKRRPILAGATDIDQLEKIFELCGTPDDLTWPTHRDLPFFNNLPTDVFKKKLPRRIRTSYDRATVNFIDSMLILDPEKRPSADDALKHDYFLTDPAPAVPGT
ncbi:kinase-like domain-containing protein, partial [Blyttiomyces helicus]